MQQKHAQTLILQGKRRAAKAVCSAGSISVFACSWAALHYWWVGRFNTLNAIPRETELTPHFHSTNSSGWKKIPRHSPLASKLQLAASGHRTVLGKKHNCLLCLSVPPPSPRAHRSWSSPCHLLTGADLFQVHYAPEFCTAELCRQIWAQHPNIKKEKSNQVRRASSILGALPSKHPKLLH